MKKCYILSCLIIFIGGQLTGQQTATPVLNKSNRIILHFKDTTGLFTALARILIDRGHDIDYKDRELGILRTKPSQIPGGYSYTDQMEVKTVFRDSTITFSCAIHERYFQDEYHYELVFTKKRNKIIDISWDELMLITGLLKPDSVTYLTVNTTKPYGKFDGYVKPPK
ncbi:MAG TPA: hypothetical protein VF008_11650 [Niastella sp.]